MTSVSKHVDGATLKEVLSMIVLRYRFVDEGSSLKPHHRDYRVSIPAKFRGPLNTIKRSSTITSGFEQTQQQTCDTRLTLSLSERNEGVDVLVALPW